MLLDKMPPVHNDIMPLRLNVTYALNMKFTDEVVCELHICNFCQKNETEV